MDDNKEGSQDILGIKPIANSIEKLTDAAIKGASAFFSRICLRAAEEYGLLLRDRVRYWRAMNIAKLAKKAEAKLKLYNQTSNAHAHPRVFNKIVTECSWIDDEYLQEMWAGLLASSCTEDGTDETNLIFVNILSQLSSSQARIISLPFTENKYNSHQHDGMEYATVKKEKSEFIKCAGLSNWGILRRELDHLSSLGLIDCTTRSDPQTSYVELRYKEVSLRLYMRCQGFTGTLSEFISNHLKERRN